MTSNRFFPATTSMNRLMLRSGRRVFAGPAVREIKQFIYGPMIHGGFSFEEEVELIEKSKNEKTCSSGNVGGGASDKPNDRKSSPSQLALQSRFHPLSLNFSSTVKVVTNRSLKSRTNAFETPRNDTNKGSNLMQSNLDADCSRFATKIPKQNKSTEQGIFYSACGQYKYTPTMYEGVFFEEKCGVGRKEPGCNEINEGISADLKSSQESVPRSNVDGESSVLTTESNKQKENTENSIFYSDCGRYKYTPTMHQGVFFEEECDTKGKQPNSSSLNKDLPVSFKSSAESVPQPNVDCAGSQLTVETTNRNGNTDNGIFYSLCGRYKYTPSMHDGIFFEEDLECDKVNSARKENDVIANSTVKYRAANINRRKDVKHNIDTGIDTYFSTCGRYKYGYDGNVDNFSTQTSRLKEKYSSAKPTVRQSKIVDVSKETVGSKVRKMFRPRHNPLHVDKPDNAKKIKDMFNDMDFRTYSTYLGRPSEIHEGVYFQEEEKSPDDKESDVSELEVDGGKPMHIPVLVQKVVDMFDPKPGQVFVDTTFGAGGHTRALLHKEKDIHIFALDRDPDAHQLAVKLAQSLPNVTPLLGTFSDLNHLLLSHDIKPGSVDGFLMDVGASSVQYDTGQRGFSIKNDGPLDMRMDKNRIPHKPTAADVVNYADEDTLHKIFKIYGEERMARRIARRIVEHRSAYGYFTTTKQLADAVTQAFGEGIVRRDALQRQAHVATKSFMALRIFVNDELNELHNGLELIHHFLPRGGKCAAVTFHSLEDRIVKRHFHGIDLDEKFNMNIHQKGRAHRALTEEKIKELLKKKWTPVSKHPIGPDGEELGFNPRSRSAKLRVAIKN